MLIFSYYIIIYIQYIYLHHLIMSVALNNAKYILPDRLAVCFTRILELTQDITVLENFGNVWDHPNSEHGDGSTDSNVWDELFRIENEETFEDDDEGDCQIC